MLIMSGNAMINSLPRWHVVAAPTRHLQRKFGGGVLRAPRQEFARDLVAGTQSRQKYPRLVYSASQQKKNNAVIICRRLQIEHRRRPRAAKFATTSLDSAATTQLLVVPSSSTDIIFGSRQSAGAVSIPAISWVGLDRATLSRSLDVISVEAAWSWLFSLLCFVRDLQRTKKDD